MPSLGPWECLVLLFFLLLYVLPIVIVARGSRRRTGQTSAGWVIAAILFGWLSVIAWAFFGSRKTGQGQA
jgi:hypothetical protein